MLRPQKKRMRAHAAAGPAGLAFPVIQDSNVILPGGNALQGGPECVILCLGDILPVIDANILGVVANKTQIFQPLRRCDHLAAGAGEALRIHHCADFRLRTQTSRRIKRQRLG